MYAHIYQTIGPPPADIFNCQNIEIGILHNYRGMIYQDWLGEWIKLEHPSPSQPLVPKEACHITTPLSIFTWDKLLYPHPHQELVHMSLNGLKYGFRIGYSYLNPQLKSARRNMQSALEHPEVVDSYLAEELDSNRLAGPFPQASIPQAQISRFGVIPKSSPGKWRLIVDLSHPDHKSVNDGIPKNLCSMYYITVDDAIRKILELGPGTELAKIDVKGVLLSLC